MGQPEDPRGYFVPPGFFRALVDCWIEALDQRVDQGGLRFGSQMERVPEHFSGVLFHKLILLRVAQSIFPCSRSGLAADLQLPPNPLSIFSPAESASLAQ